MDDIHGFTCSLTGLSGEQIQIVGYVTLKTTYGERTVAKAINYLIIDPTSPYTST